MLHRAPVLVGFYERGNEISGSIEGGDFLTR